MLSALNATLDKPLLTMLLMAVFLVLNVLDGHSTYLVLRPHNYHREKNPVARWIFRKLKLPTGIIIFKTVILAVVIPAVCYYAAWDASTINITMLIADLLFLWVVQHNYRVYKKLAGWG